MTFPTRLILSLLPAFLSALADPPAARPVAATVETTLTTANGQIRQFAFDGEPATYFASTQNPTGADQFTLIFDHPVAVKSVTVTTGKPDGGDKLDAGALEASADGQAFEPLAKFADGTAHAEPAGRKLKAVRVKPS